MTRELIRLQREFHDEYNRAACRALEFTQIRIRDFFNNYLPTNRTLSGQVGIDQSGSDMRSNVGREHQLFRNDTSSKNVFIRNFYPLI